MLFLSHHRTFVSDLLCKVGLLLLTVLIALPDEVRGQTTNPQLTWAHARISQVLDLIRSAEQQHLPQEQQGILWAELGLAYWNATEFAKAEDAYNKSLLCFKGAPSAAPRYAATLEELASLYLSYGRVSDAESTDNEAFVVRKKLGDPAGIGVSQIHLANIALVKHQFKKAEQLGKDGMRNLQSASVSPSVGVLSGFITLTYALCSHKHCQEGFKQAQLAVLFANKNFEPESAPIGFALETLGFAEWKRGAKQDAEKDMLDGIRILRKTLAPTDPRLAGAMLQYRAYLLEADRPAEARDIQQEVSVMTRQTGIGCSNCAVSVNTLSNGWR